MRKSTHAPKATPHAEAAVDFAPLSEPMQPVTTDRLPIGPEWGYQLKWDGVRILAQIRGRAGDRNNNVEQQPNVNLYSRKLLNKNSVYPEIVRLLQSLPAELTDGGLILDGEAVVFDPELQRPVFQLVLQRERSEANRQAQQRWPVMYVLFDLLHHQGEDLRSLPYEERHRRLQALFPEPRPNLFVSDLFTDGEALWSWVEQHGWEGVVAKRLSSTYQTGKRHTDWYKRKTALQLQVSIIGIILRGGQPASMLMLHDGTYIGRVSLGLNGQTKAALLEYARSYGGGSSPFTKLPSELAKETIVWLSKPFPCKVTGLEITQAGLLRHPKLIDFKGPGK